MKTDRNPPRGTVPTRAKDTAARVNVQTSTSRKDEHLEHRLDEALEETFPASDPIAVTPRND